MANKRKKRARLDHAQRRPVKRSQDANQTRQQLRVPQPTRTIPFDGSDDILLVGEGDFSFARSLVLEHPDRFVSLTATAFDTREELLAKYPQAETNIELLSATGPVESPPNAKLSADTSVDSPVVESEPNSGPHESNCTILYSVDAKKLSTHRLLKRRRYSKIVFNFPHVGGKSTDVRRQVRYNQELVHGFLHSCQPLLTLNGSVLVTLFDGEPYSLWNVRDLARSVGLIVKRSFAFDAGMYPGYRHARTLGNLKGRESDDVEVDQDERDIKNKRGGWRGEERSARTYEFGLKHELGQGNRGKRKIDCDEDTSSSGEDG